MDPLFDPEADSLKEWDLLLSHFIQEEGNPEAAAQTDWDPTFQIRRSAIVCDGVSFRVLMWFKFHNDQWYIKYEVEVSSPSFHLKSAVLEMPWEKVRIQAGGGAGTDSKKKNLGLILGQMGRDLGIVAS